MTAPTPGLSGDVEGLLGGLPLPDLTHDDFCCAKGCAGEGFCVGCQGTEADCRCTVLEIRAAILLDRKNIAKALAQRVRDGQAEALEQARDALYRGEGPDLFQDSDIVYGEWLGGRADATRAAGVQGEEGAG